MLVVVFYARLERTLSAGHNYYFSGRIRTDGFESGTEAYIRLAFWGPGDYYKQYNSIKVTENTVGGDDEWMEVSGVVEVPSQADSARVELWLKNKGQVWFDYLFLGLDVVLELTKTPHTDTVAAGDFLTYTITYSNTGLEPAQNVRIREFRDPNTDYVIAIPSPEPPSYDEWDIGILTTTMSSILDVVQVNPDPKTAFLINWVRMESTNQINGFEPVELTLWTSSTVGVASPPTCAVCIPFPSQTISATSPGKINLSRQVHNCGSITTSITMTISAPSLWTVVPSETLIPNLPPSHTKQVAVELTIPSGVPSGTEIVTWTATAACDDNANITDVIRIRLNVDNTVFLPIIAKRYYAPCPDPIGDPCGSQDPYEPNNAYCSTKTSLMSGVSIQAPLCSITDTNDYYYIDVMAAGNLEIWLTDLPTGTDYDLYLYYEAAPTEHVTRSVNYGPDDEYIGYDVSADKLGRYYIRAYAYSGWSSDPYTLLTSYPLPAESE